MRDRERQAINELEWKAKRTRLQLFDTLNQHRSTISHTVLEAYDKALQADIASRRDTILEDFREASRELSREAVWEIVKKADRESVWEAVRKIEEIIENTKEAARIAYWEAREATDIPRYEKEADRQAESTRLQLFDMLNQHRSTISHTVLEAYDKALQADIAVRRSSEISKESAWEASRAAALEIARKAVSKATTHNQI